MHRAAFVAHVAVDDQQAELAAAAHQTIASAEACQVRIGVLQQLFEVVGLGDATERLAVGGAISSLIRPQRRYSVRAASSLAWPCCWRARLRSSSRRACWASSRCRWASSSRGASASRSLASASRRSRSLARCFPPAEPRHLRRSRHLRSALIAAVSEQCLATFGEGGIGLLAGPLGVVELLLQALRLVVGLVQQPGERGVVQFGMGSAPFGQLVVQGIALLVQGLEALAFMVALLGETLRFLPGSCNRLSAASRA